MADGWRFFATRVNGDGTETVVANDVPLAGPRVSQALSSLNGLSGTIPVEVARLKGVDLSVFTPWSTAVYAEYGGVIRGGGIVSEVDADDGQLEVTCQGFAAYATGTPYVGEKNYVKADPFTISGEFWSDLQKQRSNIGLRTVFQGSNPIRLGLLPVEKWPQLHSGYPGNPLPPVGTSFVVWWMENGKRKEQYGVATRTYSYPSKSSDPEVVKNVYLLIRDRSDGSVQEDDANEGLQPGFDVVGVVDGRTKKPTVDADGNELQPWKLNFFDTLDMGQRWSDLVKDGAFEWTEEPPAWSGETITHTLRCGYPRVGRDLRGSREHRFQVGVNVMVVPTVSLDGDDYFDEVVVVGAGEGRKAARGQANVQRAGRLHRTKVVSVPSLKTNAQCQKRAAQIASQYAGDRNVDTLKVANHAASQLGSYGPGDVFELIGSGQGWAGGEVITLRMLGVEFNPGEGDTATLTVARPDKVAVNA